MDGTGSQIGMRSGGTADDPLSGRPSAVEGLPPPRIDLSRVPPAVLRELRASHMGETVAVRIYDGVVASGKDGAMTAFAHSHREVELGHLRLFDGLLPPDRRSRLMPLWRGGGWVMGWLPARIHPSVFFTVIGAVEAWVDGHYARQIALVRRLHPEPELLRLLAAVRADEARHSDHAHRLEGRPPPWVRGVSRLLAAMAVTSSRLGVTVGKWF